MIAGNGGSDEEIDRTVIVEIIDLEPAAGRGQFPAERIDEDTFSISVHLHQGGGKIEPLFGKDKFDFHRSSNDASPKG